MFPAIIQSLPTLVSTARSWPITTASPWARLTPGSAAAVRTWSARRSAVAGGASTRRRSPSGARSNDPAKEWIYSGLQKVVEPGPGYIHFPLSLDEKYFEQLTAERVVTRTNKKGFPERVWELKSAGRRNEALDCSVYSYAGLCGLKAMGLDLEREADRVEAIVTERVPANDRSGGDPKPRRRRRRVSRSRYLEG